MTSGFLLAVAVEFLLLAVFVAAYERWQPSLFDAWLAYEAELFDQYEGER